MNDHPWLKLAIPIALLIFIPSWIFGLWTEAVDQDSTLLPLAPAGTREQVTNFDPKRTDKKLIALTFDDGPNPNTTPRLLDILKEKHTHATFFTLGTTARSNPEIVKRAKNEGNEIGTHTMYHQNLANLNKSAIEADINEAKQTLSSIIGEPPTSLRPPYGSINNNVKATANLPLIIWTIDTEDWRNRNPEMIKNHILNTAFDGAIVLMHDIYPTTIDAIPAVIDELRNNGYEPVTIKQLTSARNTQLKNGEVYGSFRPLNP